MKYNLIYLAQSGYRKVHCCETALVKMVSQWSTNMNREDLTGLILLDLYKTFNIIKKE